MLKKLLDSEYYGKILGIEYRFGTKGGWSTDSGYNLNQELSGGGVLAVSGSHFLDQIIYLFGYPEIANSYFDSHGGVESNFKATLNFEYKNSKFIGNLFFSKTDKLSNCFKIYTENHTITLNERETEWYSVESEHSGISINKKIYGSGKFLKSDRYCYFKKQFENFADAILKNTKLKVSGFLAKESVKLINELYSKAERIEENWVVQVSPIKHKSLNQHKALIIGSTGFIGSAMCERLFFEKIMPFKALIRHTGHASRIARLPIEMVRGDITDYNSIHEAINL